MQYEVCGAHHLIQKFKAMYGDGPELVLTCQRLIGHEGHHAALIGPGEYETWPTVRSASTHEDLRGLR